AKAGAEASPPAGRVLARAGAPGVAAGRTGAAEPWPQQAFELADRTDQVDGPAAANLLAALGTVQLSRSQPAEAEPYLRRAAALLRRAPADPRDLARVLTHFAQAIAAQGFPEEAEPLCAEA